MIQLVTFDLYHTLCYAEPSRQERLSTILSELGYVVPADAFLRPNVLAEEMYTVENGRHALYLRPADEQRAFYMRMYEALLREAGVECGDEVVTGVCEAMLVRRDHVWKLFDDVLPTLSWIREQGIASAIISNTPVDATILCDQLGLCDRVDFIVSSCLIGCEKPDRRIFDAALDRAGVTAESAVHIGDQPRSDALGARGAGMHALLLDRFDVLAHESEYERAGSLSAVKDWLGARSGVRSF